MELTYCHPRRPIAPPIPVPQKDPAKGCCEPSPAVVEYFGEDITADFKRLVWKKECPCPPPPCPPSPPPPEPKPPVPEPVPAEPPAPRESPERKTHASRYPMIEEFTDGFVRRRPCPCPGEEPPPTPVIAFPQI